MNLLLATVMQRQKGLCRLYYCISEAWILSLIKTRRVSITPCYSGNIWPLTSERKMSGNRASRRNKISFTSLFFCLALSTDAIMQEWQAGSQPPAPSDLFPVPSHMRALSRQSSQTQQNALFTRSQRLQAFQDFPISKLKEHPGKPGQASKVGYWNAFENNQSLWNSYILHNTGKNRPEKKNWYYTDAQGLLSLQHTGFRKQHYCLCK